jgi:hypothetical protein
MLSFMAQGFFSDNPLVFFPIVALLIFMATFAIITIRALRSDPELISTMASLPLASEESSEASPQENNHE